MASQILFKMACPSCDAQVPIRDPRLLGKKVECPKCKYRFVVEEPGGGFEAVDDDAEPAGKTKTKAKAKTKGGNSTLFIGLGVGGVALAVLGVVGWLMMSSGGDPPKPAPITKPPLAGKQAAEDTGGTPASTDANAGEAAAGEAKADNPPTVTASPADANVTPVPARDTSGDISNLLPNDSFLVVNVNLDKLRFSAIGEQMFESKVGFRPNAFKEKIGIGIDEMKRLVRGENTEQKWSFNVIRTVNAINFEEVKKVLKVEKGPKSPIKGRDYYQIPPNDLLDHLTDALKSDLENREARMTKREDSSGPLGIALVDETTVVIANIDPLQEFLQAGGKPRHLNKPVRAVGDDGQPAPGADAPGNQAPPPKRGSSAPLGFTTLSQFPQPGGPDDAVLTENAVWLTIEPPLKAMMERLEDGKRDHLVTVAVDLQKDPKLVERIRSLSGIRDIPAAQLQIFGLTLQHYNLEKFWSTVAVQFFRENDAKAFEDALKKILPNLARGLGLFLGGIRIETEGADSSAANPPPNQPPPDSSGSGSGAGIGLPGFLTLEDGPASKLILNRRGRYLTVKAELNLVERAYNRIYEMTLATVTRMRGMVDMASPLPHWSELAAAAERMRKENGDVIPPGTFPVGESTGGRLARQWPPHQRVGWMARLLPYLNQDDLYRSIKHEKFWKADANLKAGSILIPTFLDPRYPDTSWYAKLDVLGNKVLGSTHFVGCAGVGLEAGDYKADDPAVAKKLGAFGYDRKTAAKDVTDGLANTIYMIQVPPGYQRPWIAGGGATVMGVPEAKSIRPFEFSHQGKRGAIVLMLDGSVRFVDASVKDDVFKALATIRGGETIDDLESVAKKVKPPKAPELKTDSAESSSN
jgi:hypothetical protein